MSTKTVKTRIQQKHDTEANWKIASGNGFIPLVGELIIYDKDATHDYERFKFGDGATVVDLLPFADEHKADKSEGSFFIEGSGTTDSTAKTSTWVGTSDRITEYYDGLTIRYKIGVAGQSTVTLNINNLGAKTVYRFDTTQLTTQFPVGSIIHLIYHADLNDGCWVTNDYDANTNTQQRVYVSTTNKEYPITARYNTTTGSSYYAEYGRYSTGVTLNPSTNTITASTFKGALTGNADTATKATQDASGNVITSTYAKTADLGALATKDTIAKTDLASGVQTSLNKADTALQSYTETDPTVPAHVKNITADDITNWNNKSNFDGNYNSLSNRPTIPTVNNATLTIQKNGSNVAAFTANSASNATANITVPTKVSDLTNDLGFKTTDNNTTYTFATGDSNGQFKVTPSGGSAQNVSIKGLGTAAYTASTDYIAANAKGAVNGVAELDANGKVPSSQLPSYVDDVIEGTLSTFPATGETGKIYVDMATNKTYRWSGSGYAEISASLALGETSSTAYRGDRGKIAYDHSQSTHARTDATNVSSSSTNGKIKINGTETTVYTHPTSSGNKHIPSGGSSGQILRWSADGTAAWGADNNTTYSEATTSAAGLMSATDKQKLDGIASGAQVNAVISVAGKTGAVTLGKSDVGLGNVDNVKQYSASNPPPYPVTKVNNKTGAVTLSASDVGADASGTASSAVSIHNSSTSAHTDIRTELSQLSSTVDAKPDCYMFTILDTGSTDPNSTYTHSDGFNWDELKAAIQAGKLIVCKSVDEDNLDVRYFTFAQLNLEENAAIFTNYDAGDNCLIELWIWSNGSIERVVRVDSGGRGTFIAEYDVTPFADIVTAFNSGKAVLCKVTNNSEIFFIPLTTYVEGFARFNSTFSYHSQAEEITLVTYNIFVDADDCWDYDDWNNVATLDFRGNTPISSSSTVTLVANRQFYYANPDTEPLTIRTNNGTLSSIPNGWVGYLTVDAPYPSGINTSILATKSMNGFTLDNLGARSYFCIVMYKTQTAGNLRWYLFEQLPSAEEANF